MADEFWYNNSMPFDPDKHRRRSIRLKGYDYSQSGMYFVTICTQNRACLFGSISDETMLMNEAGLMVEKWIRVLEEKYPNIYCGEYIVMPNHIHMVIQIGRTNVRADRRVCPHDVCNITASKQSNRSSSGDPDNHVSEKGEHTGSPLPRIIQWLKTMTTNEYIKGVNNYAWKPFERRLWQRNYYEHIIRNEQELNRIREYIRSNPENWDIDPDNPMLKSTIIHSK